MFLCSNCNFFRPRPRVYVYARKRISFDAFRSPSHASTVQTDIFESAVFTRLHVDSVNGYFRKR